MRDHLRKFRIDPARVAEWLTVGRLAVKLLREVLAIS
jgi:hypothetical protein